jgi:Ca2+-binding EF-hand superfamily protein
MLLLGTLAATDPNRPVLAQGPPSRPPDRGGGSSFRDSPEGRQRRFDRAAAFLDQMDANHNGQIDADEAAGPRRGYLDRLLERAEMKPSFPIPLKRLHEGLQRYYAQEAGQDGSGKPPASSGGPAGPSKPSSSSSATTSTVPGFGTPGRPSSGSTSASSSPRPSVTPSTGSPSESSSSGGPSMEERIRGYAGNLIRQYDADKNGSLEKEEWSHMSMNPTDADRNHDGHITLDELAAWLLAYSQNRSGSGSSSSSSSSASKMWAGTTSSGKRSYRFLAPAERLPKGLPDWFTQKDANGDGQISMSEYSSNWTDEAAAEFAKYDLNNDGVITAAECLKAQKH